MYTYTNVYAVENVDKTILSTVNGLDFASVAELLAANNLSK